METDVKVCETISEFEALAGLFREGWKKDESVSYNPHGNEQIRVYHLVKYAPGEKEAIEAAEKEGKYSFVESFVKIPSEPPGPENQVDKLIREGYEVIDHSAKDVMLVKRKLPEAKHPVSLPPMEQATIEKVTPSEIKTTSTPLGEEVTVAFRSAETGEVVKEVTIEETPKVEEPEKMGYGPFSPELLGCAECAHECNDAKKQLLWEQMCEAREWQCQVWKPKEAVK